MKDKRRFVVRDGVVETSCTGIDSAAFVVKNWFWGTSKLGGGKLDFDGSSLEDLQEYARLIVSYLNKSGCGDVCLYVEEEPTPRHS